MNELSLTISGDKIEMGVLVDALTRFVGLLRDVDRSIARRKSVEWQLTTLRYSSPAIIACTGVPSRKRIPDNTAAVIREVVHGISRLESGERPSRFSDAALKATKKLADLRGKGGVTSLSILNGEERTHTTPLSAKVSAAVEEIIGIKYESFGAIQGMLEVVTSHRGLGCTIYEQLSGQPVKADFDDDLKGEVLAAFDRCVVGSGILRRDSSGIPRELRLQNLSVIEAPTDLPQSISGLVPNFTDGEESAEWLKKRWDE